MADSASTTAAGLQSSSGSTTPGRSSTLQPIDASSMSAEETAVASSSSAAQHFTEQQAQEPSPSALNPNLPVCGNCRTQTTPLWRRAENGTTLCNACSLYQKMKGTPRPVSLKTDVIKHRNRSKGETARKKALAAAATTNGDEYSASYRSKSRDASHSRTREGAGQKSAPGGTDTDGDADYWDEDGMDYKRARHGTYNNHTGSPTRQPRGSSRGGSRSSSQQRRSDSSESRGYDRTPPPPGAMPPQLFPYPIFYYPPPGAGGPPANGVMPAGPGMPYAYPFAAAAPPPDWAAYMQHMQAAAASGGPPHPSFMPPYYGGPHTHQAYLQQHRPDGEAGGGPLAPFRGGASGSRSQSVDSFARDAERGRSSLRLPPMQTTAAGQHATVSAPEQPRGSPGALYHPYHRNLTRSGPMISDARLTPPRDAAAAGTSNVRQRRASDMARPTSSASSSGGSQEGRVLSATSPVPASVSKPPDAMRIDEVDEMGDENGLAEEPSHGPIRTIPAYERRGRSSTRKPAAGSGGPSDDVDERLSKMRVESPQFVATPMPAILSAMSLPPGATPAAGSIANAPGGNDQPTDELTSLRLKVAELEFINGILQTRITDLERGGTQNTIPPKNAP